MAFILTTAELSSHGNTKKYSLVDPLQEKFADLVLDGNIQKSTAHKRANL